MRSAERPSVHGIWSSWLGLLARVVVGGVWLVAGLLKLPDPAASVRAVRAYQLLPEVVVPTVGHLLPLVERARAPVSSGAPRAAVEKAVEDGAFEQWVANATDVMSRIGVTGTPTALIDRTVVGVTPAETVEALLAAAQ